MRAPPSTKKAASKPFRPELQFPHLACRQECRPSQFYQSYRTYKKYNNKKVISLSLFTNPRCEKVVSGPVFCKFCKVGRAAKGGSLGGRRGVEIAVRAERGQDPAPPRPARRGGSSSWPAKVGVGAGATEKIGESKLFQITSAMVDARLASHREPRCRLSFGPSCSFHTSPTAASPDSEIPPCCQNVWLRRQ